MYTAIAKMISIAITTRNIASPTETPTAVPVNIYSYKIIDNIHQ